MVPPMFKLALIQMPVVGGSRTLNLERATARVGEAAGMGAEVVLLPETLDLGWTHPAALTEAGAIPGGDTCGRLCDLARQHRVWLCAGLTERAGPKVYNAAVLIGPDGGLRLHHRKLNELEIAHDLYARGDRLAVAETSLGTIGVMICADAFVEGQTISRTLGLMGAKLILSPCAWAVPATHNEQQEPYGRLWLDNYGPVARDFGLWIAGCSNVGPITAGPWLGRNCIGCSLVVGPDGAAALRGPYGPEAEQILMIDIELRG
jgi:predicted amidohydrolase